MTSMLMQKDPPFAPPNAPRRARERSERARRGAKFLFPGVDKVRYET